MNKLKFEIMRLLKEGMKFDAQIYSDDLFRTHKEILFAYSELEQEGYIYDGALTQKAINFLEAHKIHNAVILSAGMSTRFAPLNFEIPKGLLNVKGEILIERQIKQLQEKNINEIIIVTGYMKERFEYLREKFGVILVATDDYMTRNNHASVYAAKKYLGRTIISSSDLYFTENIFQTYAYDSYYCVDFMKGLTSERGIITDDDDRIIKTMYGEMCRDIWVTLGYAYFNERFTKNFLAIMEKEFDLPQTTGKFWADIQDDHYSELYMYAKKCHKNIIHEFDSLEELREFDEKYICDSGSIIMRGICEKLGVKESQLTKIKPSGKNLFEFHCMEKSYQCRVNTDDLNFILTEKKS